MKTAIVALGAILAFASSPVCAADRGKRRQVDSCRATLLDWPMFLSGVVSLGWGETLNAPSKIA
jgi:hypothetical protein